VSAPGQNYFGKGGTISFSLLSQPVPGPLLLFGALAAFGTSRKQRKRLRESKTATARVTG
jgi:hypothetical protein